MQKTRRLLHSAKINNNCPECYDNSGLQFTFTQVISENKLYLRQDKKIEEKLYCHSCNQQIYPINYTPDIERVYQYHKKMAIPLGKSMQLKTSMYIIIFGVIVLIAVGVGLAVFLTLD